MMRCLLCGGTLKKYGPSAIQQGSDVYMCALCPNVYVVARGHEADALRRRAQETGARPPAEGEEREPANSAP